LNLAPDRARSGIQGTGQLIQHGDIEAVNSFIDQDGILWAVPIAGGPHVMVATPRGINPDYCNMIRSSLMMYKTLSATKIGYDKIIAYAEACNDTALAGLVLTLQAAVVVTMRCAIEGIENIARDSEKRD
jgi:hypothetical protein